jgi:hypothetical protein
VTPPRENVKWDQRRYPVGVLSAAWWRAELNLVAISTPAYGELRPR